MPRSRASCLLVALVVAACSKSEPAQPAAPAKTAAPVAHTASDQAKDPAAARQLIAEGAVVIDVRSPDEFTDDHLPNATNIPHHRVPARVADIDKLVAGDKQKPLVLYCSAGGRAAQAKQALEAAGYTRVVNGGGIDDLR